MKNTVIAIVGIVLFFAFIKFFLIVAGIAALGASGYFIYQAVKNKEGRLALLTKRVLPALIAMVLCFSFAGALSSDQHSTQHEDSSAKTSHKHAESTSSKDASDDDSEGEDNTDEESATSDESSEVAEASDNSASGEASTTNVSTATEGGNPNLRNNGDMTTNQAGTIVGNSRTMVYHTPGQHGYRMNSGNAVYFNSEAEAQAAGYRKALR